MVQFAVGSTAIIMATLFLGALALPNTVGIMWTWVSGSDRINRPGIYGEKGNTSIDNVPGGRYGATGCYDSLRKEFWLFGGSGTDNSSSSGMWKPKYCCN